MSSESPTFPVLVLTKSNDYLDIETSQAELTRCTALTLVHDYHRSIDVFDASGLYWTVAEAVPPFQLTLFRKLLAKTIYNPIISVTLRWNAPTPYEFAELQRRVIGAILKDDDSLTQHTSAEHLERVIERTKSFDELIHKLKRVLGML